MNINFQYYCLHCTLLILHLHVPTLYCDEVCIFTIKVLYLPHSNTCLQLNDLFQFIVVMKINQICCDILILTLYIAVFM